MLDWRRTTAGRLASLRGMAPAGALEVDPEIVETTGRAAIDRQAAPRWLHALSYLTVAAGLVFIAVTFLRVQYSVDLSDECQAIGQAYGYMIGVRPFVNEMFIQQTAALVYAPALWVYVKLFGTDGMVLFSRFSYALFSMVITLSVYLYARGVVRRGWAFLLAAAAATYIPFCMAVLNYNGFVFICFFAGLFLAATGVRERDWRLMVGSGLLFGIGVYTYPPIVLPIAVFAGLAYWNLRRRRANPLRVLLPAAIAAAVPCVLGSLLLLSFGIDNLSEGIAFTRAFDTGGGAKKLSLLAWQFESSFPLKPVLLAGAVVLGLVRWLGFSPFWFFVILPPMLARLVNPYTVGAHQLSIYTFVLAIPFVVALLIKNRIDSTLLAVFVSSAVGGVLMAWSSGNGLPNAGNGFLPGLFAAALAMIVAVTTQQSERRLSWVFALLLPLSLGASIVYSQYHFVYRDDPLPSLTTRVPDGPFKGLYTTPERIELLEQVQADVRQYGEGRQSIFFYDAFPAGYLMSGLRPMCKTIFMPPPNYKPQLRPLYIRFYEDPAHKPDVVFEFYATPLSTTKMNLFNHPERDLFNDPFRAYFAKDPQYEIVANRALYRVLVRRTST